MSQQDGPQEQTAIRALLMVQNQQTGEWVPFTLNTEGGPGVPISLPAWLKTDLDGILTQVTTIATQTTTIATQTTTIATNSTSAVTQGQLRVKGAADITNSNTTLFTAASNLTNVSLSLCNTDSSARTVTLTLNASAGTITLFSGLSIAANETVTVGEFGMLSGETIQGSASVTTVVKLGVIGAAN